MDFQTSMLFKVTLRLQRQLDFDGLAKVRAALSLRLANGFGGLVLGVKVLPDQWAKAGHVVNRGRCLLDELHRLLDGSKGGQRC